jgi:multidrug resistance efflux pump
MEDQRRKEQMKLDEADSEIARRKAMTQKGLGGRSLLSRASSRATKLSGASKGA